MIGLAFRQSYGTRPRHHLDGVFRFDFRHDGHDLFVTEAAIAGAITKIVRRVVLGGEGQRFR
ncbi:hypothetical protein D3C87_2165450 [compost metagenome]